MTDSKNIDDSNKIIKKVLEQYEKKFNKDIDTEPNNTQICISFFLLAIWAGVVEEFIFRYILCNLVLNKFIGLNPTISIFISSFLFGIAHWMNFKSIEYYLKFALKEKIITQDKYNTVIKSVKNHVITNIIFAGIVGILLGRVYYKTGNISIPMFI